MSPVRTIRLFGKIRKINWLSAFWLKFPESLPTLVYFMKPTAVAYTELQTAYDHFNQALFNGSLPDCLITLQREKNSCGYFSAERFVDDNKRYVHEIALNPSYFAVSPIEEVMQTLVHEQCHLWQYIYGKPGRRRYHNREFAEKMESIGLMPSSTGRPGGRKPDSQFPCD